MIVSVYLHIWLNGFQKRNLFLLTKHQIYNEIKSEAKQILLGSLNQRLLRDWFREVLWPRNLRERAASLLCAFLE